MTLLGQSRLSSMPTVVSQGDMRQWLNQGPMVQEGQAWVHENQLAWDQDPTLTLGDSTTVNFDNWVMQGPSVTDGTSWMTENQFLWDHRNDVDQSPWLRQNDGTMVQLDQWVQQGPMVQDGSTWVHENQFLWDHQGEQFVFVPDSNDKTRGTMVALDQWVQQGPMVQDGSTWVHENQFLWNHQGENWVFVPDPKDSTTGTMVPLDQWLQQGPMVIAADGTQMTANQLLYNAAKGAEGGSGQVVVDNPNDPQNPWVYLPFDPSSPYSYLDPQWLKADGSGLNITAPMTATSFSDYTGKTALDIDAMKGLGDDLWNTHIPGIYDAWIQLQSDVQGIEDAIGDYAYDPPGSIPGISEIGGLSVGLGPWGKPEVKPEWKQAEDMRRNWDDLWSVVNSSADDKPGLLSATTQYLISLGNSLYIGAEMAWQIEKDTVDSIRAAGFDVSVKLPDEPIPPPNPKHNPPV